MSQLPIGVRGLMASLLVVACAGQPKPSTVGDGLAREHDVITAEELARATPGSSLLNALQTIRPSFLAVRGERTWVTIDGGPIVEQQLLDEIRAADVLEVRLRRGSFSADYLTTFQKGAIRNPDVIAVTTGVRRP